MNVTHPLTWCRRPRRPHGHGRFSCPLAVACMWCWCAATGWIAAACHLSRPALAGQPLFHHWGQCKSWSGEEDVFRSLGSLNIQYSVHSTLHNKITWMWGSPCRGWPTLEASMPWSPLTICERGLRPLTSSRGGRSCGGVQRQQGSPPLEDTNELLLNTKKICRADRGCCKTKVDFFFVTLL